MLVDIFLLQMGSEVYQLICICAVRALHREQAIKNDSYYCLPRLDILIFITADILRPQSRTNKENESIFLMMDWYSKMIRATYTLVALATHGANVFIDQSIVPYGITDHLLKVSSI